MDRLMEVATEYSKLFGKDYIYTLETGMILHVYFIPGSFHHLIGLQKLIDIPLVTKSRRNNPVYIFKNILDGVITLNDIQKSSYFSDIKSRLNHFSQIKRMVEFEKIIVNFNPSLINSKLTKADYILYKRSNDNLYLNLFLKLDSSNNKKHIPLTFLPHLTDYYTYGQEIVKIVSMDILER